MSIDALTASLAGLTSQATAAAGAMSSAATSAASLASAASDVAKATGDTVDPMQKFLDLLAGSKAPMGQFEENAKTIFTLLKNGTLSTDEAQKQFKSLFDMLGSWARTPEATGALDALNRQIEELIRNLDRAKNRP